jgi:hypothetical protein
MNKKCKERIMNYVSTHVLEIILGHWLILLAINMFIDTKIIILIIALEVVFALLVGFVKN